MKIALLTLGCKLNYAETSTWERAFVSKGLEIVPWREKADAYIINTCSVTEVSDAKSRNLIRKVHRISPSAAIVVSGCSAQLRKESISSIEGVSAVIGMDEKSSLVDVTLSVLGLGERSSQTCQKVFPAFSTGERTRSFLKVQDGCNNYCAYCTVPYARGESRNVPISDCVANARKIASLGYKEVVITGVNTGDFGRTTGESFLDLLKALNDVDGIERWRISSIEPNLLGDEIIDWIASGTKIQPHFHIPLQSGSDSILKTMGRHYDTEFFARKMEYVRKAMEGEGKPGVFFGIDVMAGLPGETDALFDETYRFIENIRPSFIHVFPYSRRPGTPAASLPSQVPAEIKASRVAALEKLSDSLYGNFVLSNRGVKEKVLFESRDRGGMMSGYSGNYIRVSRPYDSSLVGRIVDVIL